MSDEPSVAQVATATSIPLSYAQRRLWFLHRLESTDTRYNETLALRVRGLMNPTALTGAFADVVNKHDSLRTVFVEAGHTPFQRVLPRLANGRTLLELVDTSEDALPKALEAAANHQFDLARDLPIRATLFRLGAQDHAVLVVGHHVAADGASISLLVRDLGTAYSARIESPLPT